MQKLVSKYENRMREFVLKMAEKPVMVKKTKDKFSTARQEFLSKTSNRILDKKGFQFKSYKSDKERIHEFSDEEFKKVTEKEKNKNEIIDTSTTKLEKDKFKSNDFFIDISNFKLLNNDVTYEEEEEDNVGDPNQIYDEKVNILEENNKLNKNILDINFVSYH